MEADATGCAVVLVAASETCSIHYSDDPRVELLIGNTIFADGAGATIVAPAGFRSARARAALGPEAAAFAAAAAALPPSNAPPGSPAPVMARPPSPPVPALSSEWVIGGMASEALPGTAASMSWRSGAVAGQYDMWLDRSIPHALKDAFTSRGLSMLRRVGITNPWRCAWAIHPGGAAILSAFGAAFNTLRISGGRRGARGARRSGSRGGRSSFTRCARAEN